MILICDEHHVIIDNKDNISDYPVDLLKKWKRDHIEKNLNRTSGKNLLSKHPLALNKVINFISENIDVVLDSTETEKAPSTDDKIWDSIEQAPNKLKEFDSETIHFAIMIVIVDAFMRCSIFEEPAEIELLC